MRSPRAVALLLLVAACSGRADGEPARGGDQQAYERWRRPDLLLEALALRPGARVADIGAGDGYLEPHLAAAIAPGGRLVATDIDAAALYRLRLRAAAAGIEVDARLAAAGEPGLEPGAYDLVLLAEVDHLLAEPTDYLRRLIPALAPGGRIAISNRIDRERRALAAAEAAGLRFAGGSRAIPSQYVAIFVPGGAR